MAIRLLQQHRSSEAVLSALVTGYGLSGRQAYRYLLQAQSNMQLRPVPEPKTVFTVNLSGQLVRAVRVRCRRQHRPISQVVAQVLQQWLEQTSAHG
jgi:hypothetical protein